MGNLLPLLVVVPLLSWVGLDIVRRGVDGRTWLNILIGVAGSWIGLNFLALPGNQGMRKALRMRLDADRPHDHRKRFFVGFARPSFTSLLDPHEDIGYLVFDGDELEFVGESKHLLIKKGEISEIRTRINPHSFIGLGRWISVDGVRSGHPIRMLVEPREKWTLLGNLLVSRRLLRELKAWKSEKPRAGARGHL
jgi:hypothetical protein